MKYVDNFLSYKHCYFSGIVCHLQVKRMCEYISKKLHLSLLNEGINKVRILNNICDITLLNFVQNNVV